MSHTGSRWSAFNAEELGEIYGSLTVTDDGQGIEPAGMAIEILVEWQARGFKGEPSWMVGREHDNADAATLETADMLTTVKSPGDQPNQNEVD